jgi:Zn-dependent protease
MKSIQVAKFANIPIKIHWSFGLFVLLIVGYGLSNDMRGTDLVWFLGFITAMFICVILHEYGHAISARRYGVKTIDIIISPIGGLARLEKLPEKPIHEFVVAIAGPLVNVVIALCLFTILFITFQDLSFLIVNENPLDNIITPKGFFGLLIWTNMILFLFNLIPAFPMDGGRILRALLSMRFGRVRGTQWAAIVGRALAIGFIIFAVFTSDYMLIFIGIFVFVMAGNEKNQVVIESILDTVTASDIMNTKFSKIHISEPLQTIYDQYIRGGEKNYLIFDSMDNISGVVPELFIRQAYHDNLLATTTANAYMSTKIMRATPQISLKDLFEKMNREGIAIAAIEEEGNLVGVIDRNMLQNYLQLHMSRRK